MWRLKHWLLRAGHNRCMERLRNSTSVRSEVLAAVQFRAKIAEYLEPKDIEDRWKEHIVELYAASERPGR